MTWMEKYDKPQEVVPTNVNRSDQLVKVYQPKVNILREKCRCPDKI